MAELLICNQQVIGSSPMDGSRRKRRPPTGPKACLSGLNSRSCNSIRLLRLRLAKALPCHGKAVGSTPAGVAYIGLAQLGEHLPYKQKIGGSSPLSDIFVSAKAVIRTTPVHVRMNPKSGAGKRIPVERRPYREQVKDLTRKPRHRHPIGRIADL